MHIKEHIRAMELYERKSYRILVALRLSRREVVEFLEYFLDMKNKDIDDEVLDVVEPIIRHCKTLDDLGRHVLPYDDIFYDKILAKFKRHRPEPFGNASLGLSNVKYTYPTLAGTLSKVHFIYESERENLNDDRPSLEDWFSEYNNKELRVLVNHKKDGTSVVADMVYDSVEDVYEISKCTSRGKKDHGEGGDVSAVGKGLTFSAKPLKKMFGYIPRKLGVQYEMVISNKDKEKLEILLKTKFANNRSAVAGLLRRLIFANSTEAKELRSFVSLVPVGFEFSSDDADIIEQWSWDKIYSVICSTFIHGDVSMDYAIIEGKPHELLNDIKQYTTKLIDNRDKLNHDIDGVVVTLLNRTLQKTLGRQNNINKWQIAYKFPEQYKKTKVVGIIQSTGVFGYKEFLVEVEPVILNGTNQNKGQIYSLDRFNILDLNIGDEGYLKLSGDVIPYFVIKEDCNKGNGEKLKLPTHCDCGTKLVEEKNKLRCPNKKCPYRIIGGLYTFLKELNSKGIAEATCSQLYHELGITMPSEMLELTTRDFRRLKKFKDASSELAYQTIKEIREKEHKPATVLSALGIDCFRASTATKVLDVIPLDELLKMAKKQKRDELITRLKDVHGIDKNASIIADGLIDRYDELDKILSLVKVKEHKVKKTTGGLVVMLSGIRGDEDIEAISEKHNLIIKDSGKKFDILVIKSDEYRYKTKGKYAKDNNIPIYLRSEFMAKYK